MATPAVPSALRPNAPPSELKAPGRLVTTTAAGETDAAAGGGSAGGGAGRSAGAQPARASPGPLVIPEAVDGTGHPFWRELLAHIESADGARSPAPGAAAAAQQQRPPQFLAAFRPAALQRLLPAMPASVLTALVDGMAAADTPPACRAAYLRCLEAAVQALVAAEEAAGDTSLSASQQVWQPRGQPLPASLRELAREPQLLLGLQAAAGSGDGGSAAAAAASVAGALLGSEAARAAVADAAGGQGLQDGLGALVRAQAAA